MEKEFRFKNMTSIAITLAIVAGVVFLFFSFFSSGWFTDLDSARYDFYSEDSGSDGIDDHGMISYLALLTNFARSYSNEHGSYDGFCNSRDFAAGKPEYFRNNFTCNDSEERYAMGVLLKDGTYSCYANDNPGMREEDDRSQYILESVSCGVGLLEYVKMFDFFSTLANWYLDEHGNYSGFCESKDFTVFDESNPEYFRDNFTCNDNSERYAIGILLIDGTYYCVSNDNEGIRVDDDRSKLILESVSCSVGSF